MTLQIPRSRSRSRFRLAIVLIAALAGAACASQEKPLKQKVSAKTGPAQAKGPLYATRPEVMQFADELASRRSLDPAWVRQTLSQAR